MAKEITFTDKEKEILEEEYLDIEDSSVTELDISKVRGSVRLRTGKVITKEDIQKIKKKIAETELPSK